MIYLNLLLVSGKQLRPYGSLYLISISDVQIAFLFSRHFYDGKQFYEKDLFFGKRNSSLKCRKNEHGRVASSESESIYFQMIRKW